MNDRFLAKVYLVLAGFLVLAGCEQKQQEEVAVLDVAPDNSALSAASDYAAEAISAAGGVDAWGKTKELRLDCVVAFYQADGSSYLTEQHYDIYPWSRSIRISGREPEGEFAWQLSKGRLESLRGGDEAGGLPVTVGRRCFADLVMNIVTVPARLLDQSVEFTIQATATKVQGRWYYAIERRSKPLVEFTEPALEAVFYQDRDKAVVDRIRLACNEGQKFLVVRGYDYAAVEKGGVVLPARIEIFNSDAEGNVRDRLVKIDCQVQAKAN